MNKQNNLAGMTKSFMNELNGCGLLPLTTWAVRHKATQIVCAEFICKEFSWAYLQARLQNICKARNWNAKYFELA